jgi:hypothetical protein
MGLICSHLAGLAHFDLLVYWHAPITMIAAESNMFIGSFQLPKFSLVRAFTIKEDFFLLSSCILYMREPFLTIFFTSYY